MTTDITELAQRVKTEASAIDDTQWYLAKPSEIRSLVEALEKAQQYAKERDAENQDLMLTVGRPRVEREELESRTVTVKLPDYRNTYKGTFADEVEHQVRRALDLFSAAAGIKVEAE